MNSFIENLNQWGGRFLSFAWPMFWQSSLLILVVFTVDFLSRGRIRASIRYALWLVVLVKLCLPPVLALPTGAAWWLFPNHAAARTPALPKYVVTYDSTAPSGDFVPATMPAFTPPVPKLNAAGWTLLGCSFVNAVLLLWLSFRWWQISRKISRATPAEVSTDLLDEIRRQAGSCSPLRLKLVSGRMSPAVCGLFQPAILLPQVLAEQLSDRQLRAVLLHEAIHLRRRDVWVNCAQALLQIAYWWHPLLWLANARIRRLREEAVDDAVMLALRSEAEDYAPTLLAVAKLALSRPLMSLGLVGIMESRSALRQRIERLVNFRAPRKAGLTLLSLCGIFAFSAVALPMGQAPAVSSNPSLSGLGGDLNQPDSDVSATNHFPNSTNVFEDKMKADELVRDAKLVYEMGKFDEAEKLLKSGLALEPENQAAHYYLNLVQEAKADRRSGMLQTSAARKAIMDKLNRIQFDRFGPYSRRPLNEVVQELNQLTANLDSGTTAIHFFMANDANGAQPQIDPNTGQPADDTVSNAAAINSVIITVDPALTNATLTSVLDVITWGANKNIQYSISDKGIVFSPKDNFEAPRLYARTFRVHPVVFLANLQKQAGSETNVAKGLHRLFLSAGLDLTPPESIFYNEGLGLLFIRATESDLDAAEKIIATLSDTPPQIHIKTRFLEVPRANSPSRGFDLYLGTISTNNTTNFPMPAQKPAGNINGVAIPTAAAANATRANLTGILTRENTDMILRALHSRGGVEILAEPEVTTTSGRQTEMRATQIITVITNFIFAEKSGTQSNSITPQSTNVETGPILDTVATILPDGYTIDLKTTASLTEFLGYDQPTNSIVKYNVAGQKVNLPTILPSFGVHKASAHVKLWDGQTIVLGGMKPRFYDGGKEVSAEPDYFVKTKAARGQPNEQDKELLVFITVTLVDPAGNRMHSDDEMPFAEKSVPPQGGL